MGNNKVHKTLKWYILRMKGIPYTLAAVLFCAGFWIIQGAAFAKGEGVLTESVSNAKTDMETCAEGIEALKEGDILGLWKIIDPMKGMVKPGDGAEAPDNGLTEGKAPEGGYEGDGDGSVPGTDGDGQSGTESGVQAGTDGNGVSDAGDGSAPGTYADGQTGTDGSGSSGEDMGDTDGTDSRDGVSGNGSGELTYGPDEDADDTGDGAAAGGPEDSDETGEEELRSTAFVTVDDSYFDDALFIGDSRMVGIYDYCGWNNATFLCDNGYSVANYMVNRKITCQNDHTKHTPEEILDTGTFGKVYIMIGTNDAPHKNLDDFREGYASLVSLIRDKQPEAVIYVVANLNMTKNGEVKNSGRGFTNEAIKNLNAIIQEFDNGDDIFFLDFNPLFSDDEGYLDGSYSFDGFHVYASQYSDMGQFFREHAVEYSTII